MRPLILCTPFLVSIGVCMSQSSVEDAELHAAPAVELVTGSASFGPEVRPPTFSGGYADLPLTTKLQIGVMSRPSSCPVRAKKGDVISVDYTSVLHRKKEVKVDSTEERGPLTFTLGSKEVIKGLDQGLLDMCVGEVRRLTIPSHLAYGAVGAGPFVPADATLRFDVTLRSVNDFGGKDMPLQSS